MHAALYGIDHNVLLPGQLAAFRIFDVVLIVHVGRKVADQKDGFHGVRLVRPLELGHRLIQRLIDRLGTVAAAVGPEGLQHTVNRVEVVGEGSALGDILIAPVTVGDQSDFDFAAAVGFLDIGGDAPDFLFGAFDQAAHRTGGVEHEDHLGINRFDRDGRRPGLVGSRNRNCYGGFGGADRLGPDRNRPGRRDRFGRSGRRSFGRHGGGGEGRCDCARQQCRATQRCDFFHDSPPLGLRCLYGSI
ncbi:hypothetical protein SDC9_113877 [bioreactor metagenome]|uniref:Uncharacterized protein n=1 Tax=bioreactor metagenome TaxID=1076179 RepID=A0A645BUQ7_9ZZZZ